MKEKIQTSPDRPKEESTAQMSRENLRDILKMLDAINSSIQTLSDTSYVSALNKGTLYLLRKERSVMTRALLQELFFVYEVQRILTVVLPENFWTLYRIHMLKCSTSS